MNINFGNLTSDHFFAFNAIVLWHDILQKLTDYQVDDKYNNLIANANTINNINIENDINQVINDFYNYFYTDKHISNINYSKYDLLTNNYINFLNLFLNLSSKEKNILKDVTYYTFNLIISIRENIKLPIFENKNDDIYLVKYYSIYNDNII